MKLGILGCGDFLRWQEEALQASERVEVQAVYDPNRERAESWSERLGSTAAAS
jgi:predicted dehydrogenase